MGLFYRNFTLEDNIERTFSDFNNPSHFGNVYYYHETPGIFHCFKIINLLMLIEDDELKQEAFRAISTNKNFITRHTSKIKFNMNNFK